jgi:hypothetical protein
MQKIKSVIKNNKILVISILILSVLFLIFYPDKYISIDENQYLANSFRIATGQLEVDCSKIYEYPGLHYSPTGECTSKYNLGSSILFLPTVLIGEDYAFVIVFISFILSAIIFSRILKLLDINKNLVILYIFYPPFIYFSRTLFSEVFSLLFINLFIYLILRRREGTRCNILTGVVIGIGTSIRYTNLLLFGLFLLGYFLKDRDLKRVLQITLGAIPFGIIIMIINKDLYGSFFSSGYSLSGEEVFSLSNIAYNLPRYSMIFLVLYPLMLVSPLFSKIRNKLAYILPVISAIGLYSMYPYNFFEGKLSDLIVSGRVLIPIVPYLLLPYLHILNRRISRSITVVLLIILVVSTIAITIFHQSFLNSSEVEWKSPTEYFI